MKTSVKLLGMTALCALIASASHAEVTVLGWPGGPEETALRAAASMYNARVDVAEEDKVELRQFFNYKWKIFVAYVRGKY